MVDDEVPRSASPDCLDQCDCPGLSSSFSTDGSQDSSYSTTPMDIPTAKRSTRNPLGLKMTMPNDSSPTLRQSRSSSIGSTLSRSLTHLFKKMDDTSSAQCSSPSCTITPTMPTLREKYGEYIKPTLLKKQCLVGSGATAVIRLVKQHNKVLAVKEFKKRDKKESERDYHKRMGNEFCISKTVSTRPHRHIVTTFDLVRDEKDRYCTVMEYVSQKIDR